MSAPTITTADLRRHHGETEAVAGVDLSIAEGELFGLVGPDGAGKSTIVRLLAGLLGPTGGEVRVLGRDPRDRELRHRIGLVPQEHALYGDLSIDENLTFFGRLFGLDRHTFRERRQRLLAITRLAPFTERRASALSGGMYKKLALACALLHQPQVLLLDEPTNGVDPVSRRQLWSLLGRFLDDGMTVLVTTPYMDEAARCDRVALLHQGRLLALGSPASLVEEMPERTFRVVGAERDWLHEVLESTGGVVACSPAGATLRAVVRPESVDGLAARLAVRGAALETTAPDFEDLFLAAVAAAEAAAITPERQSA